MNVDYRSIGNSVKRYRVRQNLTQAELAKRVGATAQHISHIECCHTRLSLPMLLSLAEALSVEPSALLDGKSSRDMLDEELVDERKNASLRQICTVLCKTMLKFLSCEQDAI